MLRDLILYCLDKGMINVTSSEGFEIMGKICAAGYFNNGFRCGYDRNRLIDDSYIYPHYVKSATGEESYYNPLHNLNINRSFTITEPGRQDSLLQNYRSQERYYNLNGQPIDKRKLGKGIYIKMDITGPKKIIR